MALKGRVTGLDASRERLAPPPAMKKVTFCSAPAAEETPEE
jgi:hypothetical protein